MRADRTGREHIRRSWDYRGALPDARTERRDAFLEGLLAALRVAAGLGADVTLRWRTGPRGGVSLEANGAWSAGWATALLFPAYPANAWVEGNVIRDPPGGWRAFGRAQYGPERPHPSAAEFASPWSDAALAAMRLLPSGVTAAWRLRPLGTPTSSLPKPGVVEQPHGFRVEPASAPVRRVTDAAVDRNLAPQWDVRGELSGPDRVSAEACGRLLAAAGRADGGNGIVWRPAGRWLASRAPRIELALREVAALFPSPAVRSPEWPSPSFGGSCSVLLGRATSGRSWGLPVEAAQGRHALFLGETGMGKSSALLRATLRAAQLGGVVFFDPIGDTSRRLVDRLAANDASRILWVSPAVSPVSVNALAGASLPPPLGDRALSDLVQALRRVRAGRYADSPFWGPRVEEMVHLALRAAARYPNGTFREAAALLNGAGGRRAGVPPEAAEAVRELYERVRSRPEELDGARRVLDEVVRSPVLARMLASPLATVSLGAEARSGRIVLVSGDAPEVGESTSRVLLSVHLALLWNELLTRHAASKVFVVADEIQWYANESAVEIWRLGRRFNVHLWAATQSLASLPDPIRDAALTNSADLVVFRGSPQDARELSRWVAGLPVESLAALSRGEAAILLGKGESTGWVRLPFDVERPRPDRWKDAWERCRDLWGPPAAVSETGTYVSADTPGPSDAPPSVRIVLLVLWAGLLADPDAESLTVRLEDLRCVVDPDGTAVRAAGQELASVGALEALDSSEGREWKVGRSGVAALLAEGVGPDELGEADRAWRRVVEASRSSKSRKGL